MCLKQWGPLICSSFWKMAKIMVSLAKIVTWFSNDFSLALVLWFFALVGFVIALILAGFVVKGVVDMLVTMMVCLSTVESLHDCILHSPKATCLLSDCKWKLKALEWSKNKSNLEETLSQRSFGFILSVLRVNDASRERIMMTVLKDCHLLNRPLQHGMEHNKLQLLCMHRCCSTVGFDAALW